MSRGELKALPLTAEGYSKFGKVMETAVADGAISANGGRARRFNRITEMVNKRGDKAPLNISMFHLQPSLGGKLNLTLLERHPCSTQIFFPLGNIVRYLVVVAEDDPANPNAPNWSTVKAFVASGVQGIEYPPGRWHYPLVLLDNPGDFAMLVCEDGTPKDCELSHLPEGQSFTVTF